MPNRVIDVVARAVEHEVFEAKCANLMATGQKLLARIRPDSKYHDQSETGMLFPVVVTHPNGYGVVGGPGGQYRLTDVDLFAVFDANLDPIQITFDGKAVCKP